MNILDIRPSLRSIPLKKPYGIAGGDFDHVDLAFLEIELENGIIGYGSGSPAAEVVGETAEMTFENLCSGDVMMLKGCDIREYDALIRKLRERFPDRPGTMAAVDIALHDAFARWRGVPVAALFGACSGPLPTSVTIGVMGVQETLAEAEAYLSTGFRHLKVKLGRDPEEDIERMIRLHERFGHRAILRVDMNQGYDIRSFQTFLRRTVSVPMEVIEQPLPTGSEEDLRALPSDVRHLLAADESLKDVDAAKALSSGDPVFGIINIKLMKCGGIMAAREIAKVAAPSGIRLFWGCNDESVVSIAAALHVAYSCPNTEFLDLDGSFDLAEDLFRGGFVLRDGLMHLVGNAGLGVDKS
jgi:L-alanine-DL-glutamate epimerase-like enolase superfamily enzyme